MDESQVAAVSDHLSRNISQASSCSLIGSTYKAGKLPRRPSAATLLETPGALLSRTDLRELGLERRAVDAVFRALDVIILPGYSRPLVRAADYHELLERSTYDGSRVR